MIQPYNKAINLVISTTSTRKNPY